MTYLFKNSKELSNKEKKRKHRGWFTLTGLLLVLVQFVLTIMFEYRIIKVDLLPMKYLLAISGILIFSLLYDFTSQFTKAHFLGKFIAVVMSVALIFTYLFASKIDAVLNKITQPNVNVDKVDVIVLKDDPANSLDDMKDYIFGYNSAASNPNVTTAFSDIKKDLGKDISPVGYKTWKDMVDTFYSNKDINALVINHSMINIIKQEYEDFPDKIKTIKTYEYEELVDVKASNVNVKKDPFIIYVSGISSDDGEDSKLSSYALSDVNILAVINPETRQVLLVTTPRDSYVKISNNNGVSGLDKLTHAGNYGIEKSIEALENLYNIDVDYYVKINFTGSEAVVDALGGITIDSEVEFINGDDAAPINYHFVVGENECDGAKTVAFTRERQVFADGDFQRGRNQAAAIKGIINKATSTAILTRYSAVLDAVSDMFLTNIPNSAISNLVKMQLGDSTSWNIQTYSISGGTGYRYCEVTDLYNAAVVLPSQDDINMAMDLISKIMNDEKFDVDSYVESKNN